MGNKRNLERTLDKVNLARNALGLEKLEKLPKGIPGAIRDCPIYNALGGTVKEVSGYDIEFKRFSDADKVAEVWYNEENWSKEVSTPSVVQQFIDDFDSGKYPEYVKVR